jgi:CRP-like cAMP-binding protein
MDELMAACSALPLETHGAGETLLAEGSRGSSLYILIEGEVKVMKGGNEIARIAQPGAIFGEISALLGTPYSANVVAVTKVRAYKSDEATAFIADNPAIAMHTARVLAQRLYHATTYLADLKEQFADKSDHFGLMDRILDELMQQQRSLSNTTPRPATDDPRL